MALELLELPAGWRGIPTLSQEVVRGMPSSPLAPELHVMIDPAGGVKVGTCEHCVIYEQGRPDRAWDAEGDRELDFDRDQYFALLASLGIVITERQAYVCP